MEQPDTFRVERGPDGHFQWVRPAPTRPRQNRDKVAFVQDRRRRRSNGGWTSDRSTMHNQTGPGFPTFQQIERLVGIYVATGEGQGAYLAARASEETKGPHYSYEIGRRHGSRASHRRSTDSSHSSSDDYPRPGPRRPPRRGPFGGPEGPIEPTSGPANTEGRLPFVPRPPHHYGEDSVHMISRRPTYAPRPQDDRVWMPLRMTRDADRRFLHVEEYDPARRSEYEPDFESAAYMDDLGPQPINTPRPAHTRAERPVRRTEERVVYQVVGGPAATRRRRYQAHVDDTSDDEDGHGIVYADLPPQEDDFRTKTQIESSRRRQSSGMRGGGDLDYDPEDARSDRDGPSFLRLRGGVAGAQPPTGLSALAPDSVQINTEPRQIK